MTIEKSIENEIKRCRQQAIEYREDEEKNTNGSSEFWKGKAVTHEYIAVRLQRVLDWHKES